MTANWDTMQFIMRTQPAPESTGQPVPRVITRDGQRVASCAETMTYVEMMGKKIEELSGERLVETNEGTYSATEAHAAIGVGDPQFADYRIFESLSGSRRIEGCNPAEAPGRTQYVDGSAKSRRKEIKKLRELIDLESNRPNYQPVSPAVVAECK